jgi:hypothetical protein
MAIVIQIAFPKMLAEPRVGLDIVRSQIPLLAGIQGVKVRTRPRCTLCSVLISYQIISRGLILAGGRWCTQWICGRRLRTTDDIVPLGRVLWSGRALRWGLAYFRSRKPCFLFRCSEFRFPAERVGFHVNICCATKLSRRVNYCPVAACEPLGLRHLHSTYEIDDQSNDENSSENAADIHEVLRCLT